MRTVQPSRWSRYAFNFLLFAAALTGFAQMPIFKRYYIADLPGLGWLTDFYFTHTLHYLSAMALIALGVYLFSNYLLLRRRFHRISVSGYLRGGLLFLIVATGILLVFRNLPGYRYAPNLIVALNLAHLGLVLLFLISALAGRVLKKRQYTWAP